MKRILCGKVGSPHGVQGWVKVHSFTDPPEQLQHYRPWYFDANGAGEVEVGAVRPHKAGLVAQLEGIGDRDDARALTNREIWIDRTQLPESDAGEYYWQDLEACEVVNISGESVGRVDHLLEAGAHDVLVIKDAQNETLVPFVYGKTVKSVDLDTKTIVIDWDWQ